MEVHTKKSRKMLCEDFTTCPQIFTVKAVKGSKQRQPTSMVTTNYCCLETSLPQFFCFALMDYYIG